MNSINILEKGLYLENYKVLIEWTMSFETFENEIKSIDFSHNENVNFSYDGYSLQSKILNLPYDFLITFNFIKKVLTTVNLSVISQENLSFEKNQLEFEKVLGKANQINKFNFCWKFKTVKIMHYVVNRVGLQEYLIIDIYKN